MHTCMTRVMRANVCGRKRESVRHVCVCTYLCMRGTRVHIYVYILVCVMCKTKRDEETEREEGGSQARGRETVRESVEESGTRSAKG